MSMMKIFLKPVLLSFMCTGLLACADQADDKLIVKQQTVSVQKEGVPGGVTTTVSQMTAKVIAIDYTTRNVTLKDSKDNQKTLTIAPEAVNFQQVKVGDIVMVEAIEEVAIAVRSKGEPNHDGATIIAAKAKEGQKPAGVVSGTVEITCVVTAINLEKRTATLTFPDGSMKTVQVRKDVDLTKAKLGDEVVIQASTAIAISVSSP